MIVENGNIVGCDNCHNYNLDFVQNLQNQVASSMANRINTKRISEKNDLGKCFNQEAFWKLNIYNQILQEISYCDACFGSYNIEDITGLVKNAINAK